MLFRLIVREYRTARRLWGFLCPYRVAKGTNSEQLPQTCLQFLNSCLVGTFENNVGIILTLVSAIFLLIASISSLSFVVPVPQRIEAPKRYFRIFPLRFEIVRFTADGRASTVSSILKICSARSSNIFIKYVIWFCDPVLGGKFI